ncbi:MAG: hypothetical protein Q4F41_08600 [Eubacteriales bacterium]|nr:hypothetical protein [Eubacteriales bacterium]
METENTLAKNITAAADKAAYDASCKRLLANKNILAWILKGCIEEYRDCDVNDIAECYIEGEPHIAETAVNPDEEIAGKGGQIRGSQTEDSTINEGTITYDIRFYAIAPRTNEPIRLILNVEAQNDFYPGYPIIKRGIYYCSRMVSSQYGIEFTDSHYEGIKKVYSIWICANPPKYRENTINRYFIQEEHLIGNVVEKREHYDLLTAVMICLGHDGAKNDTGILKLLNVLLSSEKELGEKKKILREDFSIPMTQTFESEVQTMCNLSKGVEEKGIAIGKEIGKETSTLQAIKNLMETLKLTAEQAMAALKIPDSDREKYTRMLNS